MSRTLISNPVARGFVRHAVAALVLVLTTVFTVLVAVIEQPEVMHLSLRPLLYAAATALLVGLLLAGLEARVNWHHVGRLRLALQSLVEASGGRITDAKPGQSEVDHAEAQLKAAARAFRSLAVEQQYTQTLLTAQSAERAEFFAKLSHELRSPLNAILGYSAILLEEPDEDASAQREDLHRIRHAGQSLLSLIDDLLDQDEGRNSRSLPDRIPFDLHSLIDRTARQVEARPGQVVFAENWRENQCIVFGNRDRVTRAVAGMIEHCGRLAPDGILKLASNLAAGRPGFVALTLDASPVAAEVTGAAPDIAQQISDGLISSVGGEVSVSRPEPETIRYQLILPMDNRNKVADNMVYSPSPIEANHSKGDPLALVIDDDPAAIDLLGRWIKRCGYRVASAASGEEGVTLARQLKPDIVLLDALMPGRSGYEVLPELRELPGMQATPILMVTVDDDRARGLSSGATDVVRKPVSESQLRSLVSIYEESRSGDVLIVDDDEDAAEILGRTVRRLGLTPRRASNGEEGLAMARAVKPKAILLDLNMPKLNGFQFIEALSREEELAGIPLIVVSGADLTAPQHSILVEAGARYYLKGSAAPREIAEGVWEAVA